MFKLIALLLCSALAHAAPEKIRLVAPIDGANPQDSTIQEAVSRFNSSQKDVQVEVLQPGGPFESLRSIISAHYAGDLPDLAIVNEADLPTLKSLNILQGIPENWPGGFNGKILNGCTLKGNRCSLPFQRKIAVWYFNQEQLFRLNQDTQKIPTSWAALAPFSTMLAAAAKKPAKIWGLAIPSTGDRPLSLWTALGLGALHPPVNASLHWARKIWQERASFIPGALSIEEATKQFLEENAVILLGGLEQWNYIKANAQFKWAAIPIDGEQLWTGTDLVLLSKKSPSALKTFVQFLYRPDTSLAFFKAAPGLPLGKAYLEDMHWKQEIDRIAPLKTALKRNPAPLELEKVPPQARNEWASALWRSFDPLPSIGERPDKERELKATLEKLLSRQSP